MPDDKDNAQTNDPYWIGGDILRHLWNHYSNAQLLILGSTLLAITGALITGVWFLSSLQSNAQLEVVNVKHEREKLAMEREHQEAIDKLKQTNAPSLSETATKPAFVKGSSRLAENNNAIVNYLVFSLESEGENRKKVGAIVDYGIVLWESEPFPEPTTEFELELSVPHGFSASGFYILKRAAGDTKLYGMIGSFTEREPLSRFRIPECARGDAVTFVVRLETENSPLPSGFERRLQVTLTE